MKEKLTPWFPGDVKPKRTGVYRRKPGGVITSPYSFWNGAFWCISDTTPRGAGHTCLQDLMSLRQDLPWRGLAKNPAKKGSK